MLYPKDPQLRFFRSDDELRIEWNWNRRQGWNVIVLGVVFYSMLVFEASQPIKQGVPRTPENVRDLLVMSSLVFLIAITFGLFQLLNRNVIIANRSRVAKLSRPLRVRTVEVNMNGVLQFFVRPAVTRSFFGHLFVMNSKSECMRLTSSAPSLAATYQICHELQDFYGLEDLPVYGQNTQPNQPGPRIRSSNT